MSGPAIESNVGLDQQQTDAHVDGAARAADVTVTDTVAQDDEEQKQINEAAEEEAREKLRREREARAQALTLEIVGDLPFAEVKPPENVLFVCKLNPVTEDDDLETIFSRFGTIVSCEVIRDKRTKDSLQYAFIEFEHQKDCEQAYFKMQGVLIDDHRIHVDFSQSVSRLSDKWRTATNSKRAKQGGGFGGEASLEKRRQYRVDDRRKEDASRRSDMVFEKDDYHRPRSDRDSHRNHDGRGGARSRSPRRRSSVSRERSSKHGSSRDKDHGRSSHRHDRYDERDRRHYR